MYTMFKSAAFHNDSVKNRLIGENIEILITRWKEIWSIIDEQIIVLMKGKKRKLKALSEREERA